MNCSHSHIRIFGSRAAKKTLLALLTFRVSSLLVCLADTRFLSHSVHIYSVLSFRVQYARTCAECPKYTLLTVIVLLLLMHCLQVPYKISGLCKSSLTHMALVVSLFLMHGLQVLSKITGLCKSSLTHMAFVLSFLFMHSFDVFLKNASFECREVTLLTLVVSSVLVHCFDMNPQLTLRTKAREANFTLKVLDFFMH